MMIIHQGYENLIISNPVVALGSFDGVHLGHKVLINKLVDRAESIQGESVIITFHPHPRLVLSGEDNKIAFLTSLEEKITLLEKEGVNHLIIIPFDHELSNKEACRFIEDILVEKIGSRWLIAGFNHHFGKKGDSDFAAIRKCAESFNIKVEQLEALRTDKAVISSSSIREALISGNIEEANKMLGYNYFVKGTVARGKQIGRELGFPTANIVPDYVYKLVPRDGVYAVEVVIKSSEYYGMMSIGMNPTISSNQKNKTLEVNIFDFDEDVYESGITVIFKKRLRDILKYENRSQLVEQLEDDKRTALSFLKG
jgi:riboflavin kinase / FMN adenylyltransferase